MNPVPAPHLPTTWTQSHKAHATHLSFLDLPRELRDQIYTHALHVPGALFIYSPNLHRSFPLFKAKIVRHKALGPTEPQSVYDRLSTGLLRTCRQLHAESSPVLYCSNVFRIWLPSDSGLALQYRNMVRHVTFTTEEAQRVFSPKLDIALVRHGWKRRFWPGIIDSAEKLLVQFPHVHCLSVLVSPGQEVGAAWRPAFFANGDESAEERVEGAARWLSDVCPVADERVKEVLSVELVPPKGSIAREEYVGSRFAPEEGEWDYEEFAWAFELMKVLD
ncbi:hypothetical protein N0V94_003266 [Neodidymelliopsis sp. IMI 364377]|nr:hypothetical protein N0V94_003266 [Neodidymelliopsis sp. IMI 364377]